MVALLLVVGCVVGGARLGLDRFGFQRLKLGVEPAVLWPVDDRIAEVRTMVQPCMACDPFPAARLDKVMVLTTGGWREAAPGEFQKSDPEDERRLLLAAGNDITAYGLHYHLSESNGREMKTSIVVLVRPDPPRTTAPFWTPQRLAQEAQRP